MVFLLFISYLIFPALKADLLNNNLDSLTPYVHQHGSRLNYRAIRECHRTKYGTVPHELYSANTSKSTSFLNIKRFVKVLPGSHVIRGHYARVSNPVFTLSVLEPNQVRGCSLNIRQTVAESAKQKDCIVAVNAGLFHTKTGECLGNIVSDGRKVQDSGGIQNAHFGIKNDGNIFVGYVSEEEMQNGGNFKQLVGGVIWLLRNGKGFVNESKSDECEDTEETGSMDRFVNISSARTAIGHDKDGNVLIFHVDGKSDYDGVSLWEFQNLLAEFGVINAVNLDGGGSSTFVVNGTVINYPYDTCPNDSDYAYNTCARKVSTILCVHSPYCIPDNCSNHGACINGQCLCENNWLPPHCDQLMCGKKNCSSHGFCTDQGCLCESGFYGKDCDLECPDGWYGRDCKNRCVCLNKGKCNPVSGSCICSAGFIGEKCEHVCPYGFFGNNCSMKCNCQNPCFCDAVNGACSLSENTTLVLTGKCVAEYLIKRDNLIEKDAEEKRKWKISMIVLSAITACCTAFILVFLFYSCSCSCQSKTRLCSGSKKWKLQERYALTATEIPAMSQSESSDEENAPAKNYNSR